MSYTPALVDPFTLKDEDGYFWLKGNLHSHTTNSDGRATPQERVDGYRAKGYDFLSITDHHKITPVDSVKAPEGLILIPGAELHPDNPYGGQKYHLLAVNFTENIEAGKMPVQHVIDAVKSQGGSIWLAHPYWSGINILRDVQMLKGLDGIEVFNASCRKTGRGDSSMTWDDWMNIHNRIYPAIATDDVHASDTETYHDAYQGWTWVRVKERTPKAIIDAIVNGASYCSNGPVIHDIQFSSSYEAGAEYPIIKAHIRCSKATRIAGICELRGSEYHQHGQIFEEGVVTIFRKARLVRFEVFGPDGSKAWSNPYDLSKFYENL